MLNYIVFEISGRQYKLMPNQAVNVDYLGENIKNFECDKILLKSEAGKLIMGEPYLKEKILLEVLENTKFPKIRVATYKAKANTRKVRGQKRLLSRVRLFKVGVKKTEKG